MKSSTILIASVVVAIAILLGAFTFLKPQEEVKLPVVVEEYLDYNCIHCKDFYPTAKQLHEVYKDNSDVEFKIVMHPILGNNSLQAAFAAEAAREQGKVYEYSEALYNNFEAHEDKDLVKYAEELNLDMAKFNADRESKEIQDRVTTQMEENTTNKGINGTPTVFVNGRRVIDRDFDNLKKLIDEKIQLGKDQAAKN